MLAMAHGLLSANWCDSLENNRQWSWPASCEKEEWTQVGVGGSGPMAPYHVFRDPSRSRQPCVGLVMSTEGSGYRGPPWAGPVLRLHALQSTPSRGSGPTGLLHSAPQPSSLEPSRRRRASPRPGMLTFGRQGVLPCSAPAHPASGASRQLPGLVCSWHLASSEFLECALLHAVPTAWTLLGALPCLSPVQLLADLQGLAQDPLLREAFIRSPE